jgi:hypothetical protein
VAEKAVAMNTDDVGRDLVAVEQLQRKQEALERDMTAIEGKLKVQLQYILIAARCLWRCASLLLAFTMHLPAFDPVDGCESSFLCSVMVMFRVACCEHIPWPLDQLIVESEW